MLNRTQGHGLLVMIVIALVTCGLMLSGCGADLTKAEKLTPAQAVSLLDGADEITMKKAALSWGDRWDVYADDDLVATITGEALYYTDTYTMRATDGNIICSEEEQLSLVTAKARKFDADGNVNGWFDQEFTLLFAKIRILDKDKSLTGSVEQNFAFTLDADIKDADGNVAWHLGKDMISFNQATLHLSKKASESSVDVRDAVMVAAVLNELTEAHSSDD